MKFRDRKPSAGQNDLAGETWQERGDHPIMSIFKNMLAKYRVRRLRANQSRWDSFVGAVWDIAGTR
jgi:hypothetical protein